jgi:hypothetical protein
MVDMEPIYDYRVALAIIYKKRAKLTMRSYCWLRDLFTGDVRLNLLEFPNFF